MNVILNPVANQHSSASERIIEFSSPGGGGLISFRVLDGKLIIEPYRMDDTVEVRLPKPQSS